MKRKVSAFLASAGIIVLAGLAQPGLAQQSRGLGNNAALQYYSAFFELKDADLSDADLKELGEIISGAKPYDEGKFGTLVESNAAAVETMMIGTALPDCDWGLAVRSEKLGWKTPVAYFWRSRALGRLDILFALRAWSKGDQDKAVNALAQGMLFARHVSIGGPLVPALIAKMLLMQQLSTVNRWVDSGKLTSGQKELLKTSLADLGTNGIDWEGAIQTEMNGLKVNLDMLRSMDQGQILKLMFGKDVPRDSNGVTRRDWENLAKVTQKDYADLAQIASLFMKEFRDDNPEPVKTATRGATSVVQAMIPNPEKTLKAEQELKTALQETKAKLR